MDSGHAKTQMNSPLANTTFGHCPLWWSVSTWQLHSMLLVKMGYTETDRAGNCRQRIAAHVLSDRCFVTYSFMYINTGSSVVCCLSLSSRLL